MRTETVFAWRGFFAKSRGRTLGKINFNFFKNLKFLILKIIKKSKKIF